jgi:hypothetical protein
MSKTANESKSASLRITLSTQSVDLLELLAQRGIYGRNAAEVAGRFVDSALQNFVNAPKLELKAKRKES